jgi:hypothetical protein
MLLPMVWMRIARLASEDSVFSSLIADSDQLEYYL